MSSKIDFGEASSVPASWAPQYGDRLAPSAKAGSEMSGKVVFVTTQSLEAGRAAARRCMSAGADVAVVEDGRWAVHLFKASDRADDEAGSGRPIACQSWAAAADEVIDRFGPIDLWIDTRATPWPTPSRSD